MTEMPARIPIPRRGLSTAARGILAGAALLLPTLSLLPLGGMYLWEHGLLLWWAFGALAMVTLISLLLRYLLRGPERAATPSIEGSMAGNDPLWSDDEARAWSDVLEIAAKVDVERMNTTDYFVELGQQTLNTVARRLHPEKTDALWRFTLPEALAIVERVSRRLGRFAVDAIPFGDRLTMAQVLAAYRWRGVFDVAERAYDIWRVLRLVNPATAVTNEARERLSRAVYTYGKEHVSRRIAEAFVEEVGRAAIDLYGGRLAVAHRVASENQTAPADPLEQLGARKIALNVVVAGGTRGDRLAVSSLLGEAARHEAITAGTAPAEMLTTLSDPVAARADADDAAELSKELAAADVVVWIVGDGVKDAAAMSGLRARLKATPGLSAPMLIPVGIGEPSREEEERTAAAGRALGAALDSRPSSPVFMADLDVASASAIRPLLNAVGDVMVKARRVHIGREISAAKGSSSWTQQARQVWKAAGSLTRAVAGRKDREKR